MRHYIHDVSRTVHINLHTCLFRSVYLHYLSRTTYMRHELCVWVSVWGERESHWHQCVWDMHMSHELHSIRVTNYVHASRTVYTSQRSRAEERTIGSSVYMSHAICVGHELLFYIMCHELGICVTNCAYKSSSKGIRRESSSVYMSHELYIWVTNYVYESQTTCMSHDLVCMSHTIYTRHELCIRDTEEVTGWQ